MNPTDQATNLSEFDRLGWQKSVELVPSSWRGGFLLLGRRDFFTSTDETPMPTGYLPLIYGVLVKPNAINCGVIQASKRLICMDISASRSTKSTPLNCSGGRNFVKWQRLFLRSKQIFRGIKVL